MPVPLEETRSQLGFQAADTPTQCRLGEIEQNRRTREATYPCHLHERLYLIECHRLTQQTRRIGKSNSTYNKTRLAL
jgi:hypothetical protein